MLADNPLRVAVPIPRFPRSSAVGGFPDWREYPWKMRPIGLKSSQQVPGQTWRPAMAQPQPEKRSTRRFSFVLPISVKFLANGPLQIAGHTRDVSSRGVFMYLEREIEAGTSIEFVMTLPPEITLSQSMRVRCVGRVL